ncbi:endonuclease III [Candidatus Bathyarchaeota archaeon]|nr:endonuclease III [Candidatus Bathyarchaeota archaeon]
MNKEKAEKILQVLRKTFKMPKWITSKKDPFETLIITIISQNTADKNTARAFQNLSRRFKIKPEVLAEAETVEIENCLRVAGLYRNKARIIKKVSKIILKKFGGTLKPILSLPLDEARKKILSFPGVGPKTADVILLFCAQKPTIPVDTHVNRVSKRLGLAPKDGDYEAVRKSLQALYDSKDYLAVHILFIILGRKYCKAGRPYCDSCPVRKFCSSRNYFRKVFQQP